MTLHVTLNEPRTVRLTRSGEQATVWIDDRAFPTLCRPDGDAVELSIDGLTEKVWAVVDRDTVFVHAHGRSWRLTITNPIEASLRAGPGADAATAPMPGVLVALSVGPGDDVTAGQTLAVIESMKMQTEIKAPRDGVVDRILFGIGESFSGGAALITLQPETAEEEAGT